MERLAFALAVCFLCFPPALPADEGIPLDKLSDCKGVNQIRAMLDRELSDNCKPPRNTIESKVISQYALNPAVRTCLLSAALTPKLSRFSCVDLTYRDYREVSCFRLMDKETVDRHESGDAGLDTDSVKYVNEIAACSFPQSNATSAQLSVFPSIFRVVASPRFGFALQMGSSRNVLGYHGFADADPEIASGALGGLEVFDMFKKNGVSTSSSTSSISTPRASGDITLEIDDALDQRPEVEASMREQYGMPAIYKIRTINLKYTGDDKVPTDKRRSDLDVWLKVVTSVVKDVGFREPTQSELSDMHLKSMDDLRQLFIEKSPFGFRDTYKKRIGSVVVLMDDELARCIQVADIMVYEPENGVKEDYGGFGIVLLGLGDRCHRADDTLSDGLLASATRELRKAVKNQ